MIIYREPTRKSMMKLSKTMNIIGKLCLGLLSTSTMVLMIVAFGVFKLDGEYAWSELPEPVRYLLLAMGFFLLMGALLLIGSMIIRNLANQSILANGQAATAKIVQLSDTGESINDNPVINLQLEVYPSGQPSFRAEARQTISRLQIPQVQPGNMVYVRYDPDSLQVVLANEGAQTTALQGGTRISNDRYSAELYGLELANDGKPVVGGSDWSDADKNLLEREGKDGFVTLRSVENVGRSQGFNPLVRLSYDVFIPLEESYKVTKEIPMPTAYALQLQKAIGRNFPARVHPHNRERLVVNFTF